MKRFLRQLARFSFRTESSSTLPILLALRKEFRTIRRSRPLFGLVWCITRGDPDTRRLAIWLFGRVANRHQTSVVAPLSHDRDVRIRKEVAKALRRLGAWAELREIATREDDPVVRRIAKSAEAPPREFSERMGRFLDNDVEVVETPDEASLGAKSLYVNTTVGDGTPPKSRWYIRLILERIRWLVGRHVSKFSDKPPKPRP
ncbi:MAG: HEAT repeat domain-containing protein [Planctomycetes bacterium]|nr:HEAT repeat domain-containing protein [Planctomycetota bacterium]MBL7041310.1 HEAT repeat domain-containing protein [Pirellulaceae bacterium]